MTEAIQKQCLAQISQPRARSVLIVEDDKRLVLCLARAMEARGFKVMTAEIGVRWLGSNKAECTRICCGGHAIR